MKRLPAVAQVVAIVFWILTACYALLASQTFVYEQFLRPQLVPSIAWFARHHQVICIGLLAGYLFSHLRTRTERQSRVAVAVVACAWGLNVVRQFLVPLAAVSPGPTAYAAIAAALILLLLVATVDILSAPPIVDGSDAPPHASDFVACLASAGVATAISTAIGFERGGGLILSSLTGIVTSALLHLVLFVALFLLLTVVRSVAALAGSRRVEVVLTASLLIGHVFLFLARAVLPSIVSNRSSMFVLAGGFALAISLSVVGRGLRSSSSEDDALKRVLGALSPRVVARWDGLFAWLAVVGVAAWSLAKASETADWNFIVSNMGVALTWVLVLATLARSVQVTTFGKPLTLVAATGAVLALNVAWTSAAFDRPATSSAAQPAGRSWNSLDPAARFLTERVSVPAAAADETLVDLLQHHTNVAATMPVAPVDVSFGTTSSVASYRPHIFLIVIDSLRRDYVGAYNSAVTFTPSLDAFGRDNVVFDRAFTRYGATGLAVPSIWTGGMLLHKQYVTPFAPMNTLARLLADQRYAQWVGMDNIMDVILPASEHRQPLDARRMVKDFRSCQTLAEIRTRLGQRQSADGPVFAYTLPQDIHVSTLTREGRNVLDSGGPDVYDGFDAAVASRIRAVDRCFGEFIADLKARKLYDDSIVIVTSDHGDSLGENGRMGHAYTLYPEIVQIPLLVHVPRRLVDGLEAENEGPVFSTDITPTLYALLGVSPRQPRSFFGRSLFRSRGSRPREAGGQTPVLAASYGAVYGALLGGGRTLYVLDTINMREHAFTLDGTGPGVPLAVDANMRVEGQKALRDTVEAIAEFYKFEPRR